MCNWALVSLRLTRDQMVLGRKLSRWTVCLASPWRDCATKTVASDRSARSRAYLFRRRLRDALNLSPTMIAVRWPVRWHTRVRSHPIQQTNNWSSYAVFLQWLRLSRVNNSFFLLEWLRQQAGKSPSKDDERTCVNRKRVSEPIYQNVCPNLGRILWLVWNMVLVGYLIQFYLKQNNTRYVTCQCHGTNTELKHDKYKTMSYKQHYYYLRNK